MQMAEFWMNHKGLRIFLLAVQSFFLDFDFEHRLETDIDLVHFLLPYFRCAEPFEKKKYAGHGMRCWIQ